jgi:hypothetical protein
MWFSGGHCDLFDESASWQIVPHATMGSVLMTTLLVVTLVFWVTAF